MQVDNKMSPSGQELWFVLDKFLGSICLIAEKYREEPHLGTDLSSSRENTKDTISYKFDICKAVIVFDHESPLPQSMVKI